jgi:AraC-like DNA-binding protein
MSILFKTRASDSMYVETVTGGITASAGSAIRPAESNWHMIVRRLNGKAHLLVVGPLAASGSVSYGAGAELLWIKLKLGTYMPNLPVTKLLNSELTLPDGASNSFWLDSAAWQFPSYENADTFIEQLVRANILARDPVVNAVLRDEPHELASRTVRDRFLRATGLTHNHIRQMQRAQQAEALIRQGIPILDAVYETGYFDQSHLTHSLKRFIGYTPTQLLRLSQPVMQPNFEDNPFALEKSGDSLIKTG